MIFTDETLNEILLDGQLGLTLYDISVKLGLVYSEFMVHYNNENTLVKHHYENGIIKAKIETNNTLYNLAKGGSSAAKIALDKIHAQTELSNIFKEILNDS